MKQTPVSAFTLRYESGGMGAGAREYAHGFASERGVTAMQRASTMGRISNYLTSLTPTLAAMFLRYTAKYAIVCILQRIGGAI